MSDDDYVPPNHPDIADDVMLYRRVPSGRDYYKVTGTGSRPTSVAFQNTVENGVMLPEMSIVLEDTLNDLEREPDTILGPDQQDWWIAQVTAGEIRAIAETVLGVVRSPDDMEPAHGDVTGCLREKAYRQAIAKCAKWYRPPPI